MENKNMVYFMEEAELRNGLIDYQQYCNYSDLPGFDGIWDTTGYRGKYCAKYGFVLLSKELIDALVEYLHDKKVLSVMSGSGYLEKHLKDNGVDIIATDDYSWCNRRPNYFNDAKENGVEDMDAVEAVNKYGDWADIILLCWPYMDDGAYNVLMEMRNHPDTIMLYEGEDIGGCTANDEFFLEADYGTHDPAIYKINSSLPRWSGIHDWFFLVK